MKNSIVCLVVIVGMVGFEPTASRPQSGRTGQAVLHPGVPRPRSPQYSKPYSGQRGLRAQGRN